MAFSGVDFRESAVHPDGPTDPSGYTYFAAATDGAYPITRGGLTFGETSGTFQGRDRVTGQSDARVAGMIFDATSFRLDLPSGAGTYLVSLAVGDPDSGASLSGMSLEVRDGASGSALTTITGNTTSGTVRDAAGTERTIAAWKSSQTTISLTFTAGYMTLFFGNTQTRLASVGVELAAAPPVITSPTATVNGTTTALVGATVPIATGTLRAVITNSTSVPSTAQVIAGQDHTGSTSGVLSGSLAITSSGVKTFNIGGLTSGTTRHVYLALEDTGGNSAVVYAGVIYPGTWRVASDVTTTGWTVTGAATHAAAINEDTAGDAAYTTSPALTGTPSSLTMALDEARPAGTYTERIRVNVSSGTGFARVVALNDAGTVQGQTADQAITSTLATYSLPLTQTGTATRLRLDVWI